MRAQLFRAASAIAVSLLLAVPAPAQTIIPCEFCSSAVAVYVDAGLTGEVAFESGGARYVAARTATGNLRLYFLLEGGDVTIGVPQWEVPAAVGGSPRQLVGPFASPGVVQVLTVSLVTGQYEVYGLAGAVVQSGALGPGWGDITRYPGAVGSVDGVLLVAGTGSAIVPDISLPGASSPVSLPVTSGTPGSGVVDLFGSGNPDVLVWGDAGSPFKVSALPGNLAPLYPATETALTRRGPRKVVPRVVGGDPALLITHATGFEVVRRKGGAWRSVGVVDVPLMVAGLGIPGTGQPIDVRVATQSGPPDVLYGPCGAGGCPVYNPGTGAFDDCCCGYSLWETSLISPPSGHDPVWEYLGCFSFNPLLGGGPLGGNFAVMHP